MTKYRECSRMREAREAEEAGKPNLLGITSLPRLPPGITKDVLERITGMPVSEIRGVAFAQNLVNREPMPMLDGAIFYLDFQYGSDNPSQPRRGATGKGQSHEEAGSTPGSDVEVRPEGTEDPHEDRTS